MKKFVVAVSGGVDSVVLLDMLVRGKVSPLPPPPSFPSPPLGANCLLAGASCLATVGKAEGSGKEVASLAGFCCSPYSSFIVAHFDHGIRSDSAADARFVEALAARYGLEFVTRREELGPSASEELARRRRYAFLSEVAAQHGTTIMTAHHQDDVCETIALNLARGTGWRGLAVLGNQRILRPLVGLKKSQLYDYALAHRLEWVEDSTNTSDEYARNRMRRRLGSVDVEVSERLVKLWQRQRSLRCEIDDELTQWITNDSRYFLTMIDEATAREILNAQLKQRLGVGATRPQLAHLLLAIKTARPGSRHDIAGGGILEVGRNNYVVCPPRKML